MQGKKIRRFPISFKQIVIFLVASPLYFMLMCLFPLIFVVGAGVTAELIAGSLEGGAQTAALALSGLATAKLEPPVALCVLFALICAVLSAIRASVRSVATWRQFRVLTLYAVIAGFGFSAYMCKINGVPLGVFTQVLSDLLKSGVL